MPTVSRLGIGTHAVPAARLGDLEDLLAGGLRPDNATSLLPECLADLTGLVGPAGLPKLRASIDACFGGASTTEIASQLAAEETGFGAEQLAVLATKSPLAVQVTFAQLRRGRGLTIEDSLRLEYRMVHRLLTGHDFAEGVRALLIDKDRRPRWSHSDLRAVPADEVEACMAPLPAGDLALDWDGP